MPFWKHVFTMTGKAPVELYSASCSTERECCSAAHNIFLLVEQCVSVDILKRKHAFFLGEIAGLLKVIPRELSKQKQCGVMSLCEHYASHVKVKSADRAQSCYFTLQRSAAQIRCMATVHIHINTHLKRLMKQPPAGSCCTESMG